MKVNSSLAYKKKNDIYAVYVNHNMFFLKNKAGKYFEEVLFGNINFVPDTYIKFLIKNKY